MKKVSPGQVRVEERKVYSTLISMRLTSQLWKKFGESKNTPPGPEPIITAVGDEVLLESTNKPVRLFLS
jgi:hypothetical protein